MVGHVSFQDTEAILNKSPMTAATMLEKLRQVASIW